MAAMRLCFLFFCLSLASVSSVKILSTIDNLITTNYAKNGPRHGQRLFFWFAQQVKFDQNKRMYLNFLPTEGDYGFHYFGNKDLPLLLPNLGNSPERYFSAGNLNLPQSTEFPPYVQEYFKNPMYRKLPEKNMDRLIVSLNPKFPNLISRVYVTAHNRNRNDFNSSDTYEIDPALILQIGQDDLCNNIIQNTSPKLTENERCCQFLKEINHISDVPLIKRSLDPQCEEIELQIKTTTEGYSKLIWNNIPANIFQTHIVNIDVCQNTYSSDTNVDPTSDVKQSFNINKSNGSLDTSVLLNPGLQPRLRLSSSELFWYGPEVDGANRVLPVRIKGCNASLQLYAKNGKACARLYIKKTFSSWKDVFYYSWVGFYKYSQDKNENYHTYQYVRNFEIIDNTTTEDYDIYQYDSSLSIAPGVQIRFMLEKKYDNILAQTTPWESDEDVTSEWSFPEFLYEPGFYDANKVAPIKIDKYDAGLQLLTKDGKACARLYIKKTFKNWKNTFPKSWVGFYASSLDDNDNYKKYQYVTKFEKMVDGTENFDIYQYNSKLTIASSMQIRFLMDTGYDKQLVATEPWKSG